MGIRLFVIAVVLWCSPAWADKPPPLDEAIKQAAAAHKPLLIEFGAEWCKPCKEFEAKTLPDARVQAALKDVVFLRYDADEDPGTSAAVKLDVDSYPTFVALDSRGVVVFRYSGAPIGEGGIEYFVEMIGKVREAALEEATVRASIKSLKADANALLAAGRWFKSHDMKRDAISTFERLSTFKDASAAQRMKATAELVTLRRRDQWARQLLAEKLALIRADPAEARVEDLVIATVRSNVPLAEVRDVWKRVLDATNDPARLNQLIYVALAADASQEALAAAQRLTDRRRVAQYVDTLAECYHVRGDKKLALKISDEAVKLSSDASARRQLLGNRERFDRGGQDSREVRQLRLRAADLWKRLESIDDLRREVDDPDQPAPDERWREQQKKMMKQMQAEHALAAKIAKACENDAGGNEEAIARLELDQAGSITSTVLLLEPTASAALRTCLTKQLAGAVVSPDPYKVKTRLTISFRHKH